MKAIPALLVLLLFQELDVPTSSSPANQRPPKHVVALDIGHTPTHPGAISASGIPEYQFNKDVVEKIKVALLATDSIEPYVVTSSDTLTLPERTRLAAEHRAELFIAIHHDSVQDKYLHTWTVDGKIQHYSDQFSGYGVFFSRKNADPQASLEYAKVLGESMVAQGFPFARHHAERVKGENREIVDAEAGVYRFDDLIVLRMAQMPAVLLECGVIVNRQEERSLLTSERQEKIAEAVTDAVLEYFSKAPSRKVVEAEDSGKRPGVVGALPATGVKLTPKPASTQTVAKAPSVAQTPSPTPRRSLFQRMFGKGKRAKSPSPATEGSELGEEEP
jgi:N-acetylmuramoyl-L-alanine amidase